MNAAAILAAAERVRASGPSSPRLARDAFKHGFPIEHFANFLRQSLQIERFLEEGHSAFEHSVAEHAVVRVAGNIKNFHVFAL